MIRPGLSATHAITLIAGWGAILRGVYLHDWMALAVGGVTVLSAALLAIAGAINRAGVR